MIVIVDGIDRVGKTTLCNKLSKELGFSISKDDTRYFGSHNNIDINTEKDNTFVNLIEQGCLDNVIFDRFHMTEYVYSKVERNVENINMLDIDERLSKQDVIMVLVYPIDIAWSSRVHGKDLTKHQYEFERFFYYSKIKRKFRCSYMTADIVIAKIIEEVNNGKR